MLDLNKCVQKKFTIILDIGRNQNYFFKHSFGGYSSKSSMSDLKEKKKKEKENNSRGIMMELPTPVSLKLKTTLV